MKNELYDTYAMLSAEMKVLEAKMDIAKEEIMRDLQDNKLSKFQNADKGTFSIVTRKTYKYTDQVESIKKQLKDKQKEEEETGVAQCSESQSLRFQI
ncbi:MAG: hypothetical protein KGL39_57655 [Patescibacteria group bacterium]|nr:hypothetical protein [Patescibacteria group bacterium]